MKIILLLGALGLALSGRKKISDVYLLLPQTRHVPNSHHVKYTIQAFEGCYRWSGGDSQVIRTTEVPGGILTSEETHDFRENLEKLHSESQGLQCYPEASIEPIASVTNPPVTVITARDQSNL